MDERSRREREKTLGIKELFSRVVKISGKEPEKEFYEDWAKIMSHYPYEIVEGAWSQIKVSHEPWNFYSLKTWIEKADYLHNKDKLTKEGLKPLKKSRVEQDDQMRSWRDNYHDLINQRVTRGKYLDNGVKMGQFPQSFADRERNRYKHIGDSLNGYITVVNKTL